MRLISCSNWRLERYHLLSVGDYHGRREWARDCEDWIWTGLSAGCSFRQRNEVISVKFREEPRSFKLSRKARLTPSVQPKKFLQVTFCLNPRRSFLPRSRALAFSYLFEQAWRERKPRISRQGTNLNPIQLLSRPHM